QLKIGARHVADERTDDLTLRPFFREKVGPRRLRRASELAPEVQLPCECPTDLYGARFDGGPARARRKALVDDRHRGGDLRQLVCTCDTELRARLQNPCRRNSHIVVLLECRSDEIAQRLVLKGIKPFLVAERRNIRRDRLFW